MTDFLVRSLATLLGALVAFGLAAGWQRHEERRKKIEAFKTALFILILQRTFLRNLEAQQLAPHRESPIRAYAIHDILTTPRGDSLDVKALAFLLGQGEAELLSHLTLAEGQYRNVVAVVEARNTVHVRFQEKLEAAQETTGATEGTLDDIRSMVGPVVSKRLEQLTESLYRFTDDAIRTNRDTCVAAVKSFRRLFPKEDLFGVEDLPLSEESVGAA